MTTATVVLLSLICVAMFAWAQDEGPPVMACNLKAIRTEDRPRYRELVSRLRAAIRNRTSMANGYAFTLNGAAISLTETAEWMNMERLCCPFLVFELSAAGNKDDWRLALTGPEGVKSLLEAEFHDGK